MVMKWAPGTVEAIEVSPFLIQQTGIAKSCRTMAKIANRAARLPSHDLPRLSRPHIIGFVVSCRKASPVCYVTQLPSATAGHFVQRNGSGIGDIEAADGRHCRQFSDKIAILHSEAAQTIALGTHDQGDFAAEVAVG